MATPKTPWNPSRTATARVTNPLPVPTSCPYCRGEVKCVSNAEIYGTEYGEWPWAYRCEPCDAYVGLHPFTAIPLGTLADVPTREARKAAKSAFNPIWQCAQQQGYRKARSAAYAWLAQQLKIEAGTCHVGWFDVATCQRVLEICRTVRPNTIPWET